MQLDESEEKLLRSVALQNAKAVLFAREKAERETIAAKEALKVSNEEIKSLLERISDGFVALDTSWRFTYLNARGEEIFRRLQKRKTPLLGAVIWDEFPEIRGSELEQNYRRAVQDQVTVEFETMLSPLEAWFIIRAYPSPDGVSIYFLDITPRKRTEAERSQAETALRASEQHFRAAFNQAAVGMAVASLEGRFEEVNDRFCEILGFTREELLTRTFTNVTFSKDLPQTAENVRQLLAGEIKDFIYEKRFVRKDGSLVWALTSVTLLMDHAGKPERFIGVVDDITLRKQAEELRSRLAAVVESSDDAIISVGLDTIITTWNKGAERMFGYSAAEVVGQSINKLLPKGRENEETLIINRIIQGERIEHYETVRTRKDGHLLDVSLSVSPIFDSANELVGISKISRDITGRKQAEETLRRSEEDLRALADSISQLAWMARPDGHIFWYNRRWYEYTGKNQQEMETLGWQALHDPDILPQVVERWTESLRTGAPLDMEFPLLGADGVFRWFLTRVNPLRDKNGQVVRWFGTNTNVDEVRRVQQALKDESQVLEILNETGKAIASQLDLKNVVQIVTDSATRLSGAKFGAFFYNITDESGESFMLYTLSGAPREAFEKFGHPRATPLFGPTFRGEPAVRVADVTKDPRYGQMAPHHGMPAGHLPVRSYLAVPVISRNGEVIGGLFFGHPEPNVFSERAERLVIGVAAQAAVAIDNARLYDSAQHEIDRRKKIEAELRAAQEKLQSHAYNLEAQVAERTAKLRETIGELEAFSYSVSHDMRSPLRAMQGYSDALLEDYSPKLDPIALDYLHRIKRSASRMDMLIQDVLAYSRVAQGDIPLRPVDLQGVIDDVLRNYPTLQPERARISVVTELPHVIGHEAYLTQAVSNILTNGVKFVAPGTFPEIEISASREKEFVRLSFQDNGVGVAAEHRQRIFQIFGRVYSEKEYEGTGIGLAIARKAAERMGGSIGVTSELGHGSCFYLLLKGTS